MKQPSVPRYASSRVCDAGAQFPIEAFLARFSSERARFLALSKALRLSDVYATLVYSSAALHPHTWRLKKLPAAGSDPAGLGVTHSPRLPSAGLDTPSHKAGTATSAGLGFGVWGLGFGV